MIRSRRRTLALQVTPAATLVVRAPHSVGRDRIDEFIRTSAAWVLRQRGRMIRQREESRCAPPVNERECRLRAAAVIGEKARQQAERYGLAYRRLAITGARRRWGSCSAKGNLNFSWRLILAPPEVVDYVVAHELAHLHHPNHSGRFWAQVENWMPHYRSCKRWLRQNGHRLDYS